MMTRCPVCCYLTEEDVCRCGEDLRKWREWDFSAEQLFTEAKWCLERGKTHQAVLALAKGLFLKPDWPAGLKFMGDLLLSVRDSEGAAFYLERCVAACGTGDPQFAAAARAALEVALNPSGCEPERPREAATDQPSAEGGSARTEPAAAPQEEVSEPQPAEAEDDKRDAEEARSVTEPVKTGGGAPVSAES